MTSNESATRRKIVIASHGGLSGVSTKYRLGPLAELGCYPLTAIATEPVPRPEEVDALVREADERALLLLQRVLPSESQLATLREAYGRIIFDFDDAIYAAPPSLEQPVLVGAAKAARRLILRGSPTASSRRKPLIQTLRSVDVCVAGNTVLAEFAQRYAARVVEIPTTVEPVEASPVIRSGDPTVVWLGLADNLQHLRIVRHALKRVYHQTPFVLRIISSRPWSDSPIPCEFVAWSPDSARRALLDSTLGIAPLVDTPWTRGKCAFRAIQFGGHALPTIASPVGITNKVVLHGRTGYLARSSEEWEHTLRELLNDSALALRMGRSAHQHVRQSFSNDVAVSLWTELFDAL